VTGTAESEASGETTAGAQPPVEAIAATPTSAGARALDLISRRREASIAFVAVILIAYFWISVDAFGTAGNFKVITQFTASVAILAIAQVMNLVAGEIDLSLGHIYALAPLLMWKATDWGWPLAAAILFALAGAALIGLVNGAITVVTGVPSFITTLGMLFFLQGYNVRLSEGYPKPAPTGTLAEWLGGADVSRYLWSGFVWALGLTVLLHVVLTNTRWGVYTIATGGNPIGAREAGVQTKRIKVGNFMVAATLAGFSGISEGIRIASLDPLAGGSQLMFYGVAAAVIGGTTLAGGSGTIIGAFLGALVLGVLRDGLVIGGSSTNTFNMILGAAIIASMILNVAANRLRLRLRRT
jgi:simple sugar transport system permease protein